MVVLFAYQIELNISRRKRDKKILQRKLYCYFNFSFHAIKKSLDRMLFHNHFKNLHYIEISTVIKNIALYEG